MNMELKELTIELCRLPGPSGFETPVFDYIADYVRPFADEVKTDALGNLMAWKRCGRIGARTLLLDAHMDEIGLIVTAAEEGFLKFAALGGVDARLLPAREVRILAREPLFGVIDTMPPHILSAEEMEKTVPADKLYIDAGLTQEEAERLVPAGTPAVFEGGCGELGGGQLCGKALDDRSCAAILVKAFEDLAGRDLNVDLCLLISTQEEVGGRGAMTGAWNTAPDYALVLDVTFAKAPDCPDITVTMGGGPAVGIGPNMNRAMTGALFDLAKEKEIPCQPEVCPGRSGTNAEEIQVSRMGVATALVSLPLKYMHTPVETVLLEDMENTRRLIVEYASAMEV